MVKLRKSWVFSVFMLSLVGIVYSSSSILSAGELSCIGVYVGNESINNPCSQVPMNQCANSYVTYYGTAYQCGVYGIGGDVYPNGYCAASYQCSVTIPTLPTSIGISNPASAKCVTDGGKIVITQTLLGEQGWCSLPDGTLCDEWAYFRGECPTTTTTTTTTTLPPSGTCHGIQITRCPSITDASVCSQYYQTGGITAQCVWNTGSGGFCSYYGGRCNIPTTTTTTLAPAASTCSNPYGDVDEVACIGVDKSRCMCPELDDSCYWSTIGTCVSDSVATTTTTTTTYHPVIMKCPPFCPTPVDYKDDIKTWSWISLIASGLTMLGVGKPLGLSVI